MYSVYGCDYCGKIGRYSEISEHESTCDYNPKNRTCLTCKHFEERCGGEYRKCLKVDQQTYELTGNREGIYRNCPEYEKGNPRRIIPV